MQKEKYLEWFNITEEEFSELVRRRKNPESQASALLLLVGTFLTPISLLGSLIGYSRGYNRFMRPREEKPALAPLRPIVRFAMIMGAIVIWAVIFAILIILFIVAKILGGGSSYGQMIVLAGYLGGNFFICLIVFGLFRRWQTGMHNLSVEGQKFGTAKFAYGEDLNDYRCKPGLYIGGGYTFADKGHIITVAGTRGGKGTNLIIPNLLGLGGYKGSFVVVDPKAENAAVTARYQKQRGQDVVMLNPWGLLEEKTGPSQTYNPLDIVTDKTSIHLIDDIQIIAEMIVPIEKGGRDSFFVDNARAIVAGLLLHLVTTEQNPTLIKLWEWVRMEKEKWKELLAEMASNDDEINGNAVRRASYEIVQLQAAGDKTFGSIIATVLQCTDFLKSHALQHSLVSGFDPKQLSDGKTTVYIIIPADKLQSHSRWLRLVSITMLRAVVRKPDKSVTFLLDEFAALGYLPEIENALSTYAGYNITIWPILQSLIQLKSIYHDIWETFIANATIRQFFSINDNFTADYVSRAMGVSTHVLYEKSLFGVGKIQSNSRPLITADELRRSSGNSIFAFFGDKPPTYFLKQPYYQMSNEIKKRSDPNPYILQNLPVDQGKQANETEQIFIPQADIKVGYSNFTASTDEDPFKKVYTAVWNKNFKKNNSDKGKPEE